MDDVEVLKRRIRAHPAFQVGPADENYWLDFLEVTLEEFGSYEFMIEQLADSLEQHPEKLPLYSYGSDPPPQPSPLSMLGLQAYFR